jgi:mRNA interferase RelE/StbE
MPYTIEIASSALKSLGALPRDIQVRIRRVIDRLAENPFPVNVKKMEGEEHTYRLRIGEYRVVYEIHGRRLIILILRVGHRKDVYR